MSEPPKPVAALRQVVNDPTLSQEQKWDSLWQKQITPWDRQTHSPALEELLVEKSFPLPHTSRQLKGLVPGCGKGYDVVLLAGLKDDRGRVFERVVGLDVSPKAMDEARRRFENEIKEAGNIEFVKGDFFANEEWAKEGPYDVVYDYTFLCALPPSMRKDWAKRMSEIISPGGVLIALQHPLDPKFFHQEDESAGPPWLLSPQIYEDLLGEKFERVYFERPGMFHAPVGEKDYISVYRRK